LPLYLRRWGGAGTFTQLIPFPRTAVFLVVRYARFPDFPSASLGNPPVDFSSLKTVHRPPLIGQPSQCYGAVSYPNYSAHSAPTFFLVLLPVVQRWFIVSREALLASSCFCFPPPNTSLSESMTLFFPPASLPPSLFFAGAYSGKSNFLPNFVENLR